MVVILQNVRSMHNVGSIFRTADALGVEKIYLGGITPSPKDNFDKWRQQLSKVALGSEKSVAWDGSARSPRAIIKLLEKLKEDGYKIFAVEQAKNSIPYYKLKTTHYKLNKLALVFGNEIRGLSKAMLKSCDKILEIPMSGAMVRQAHHPRRIGRGKESLNVSISFGIVGYHLAHCSK